MRHDWKVGQRVLFVSSERGKSNHWLTVTKIGTKYVTAGPQYNEVRGDLETGSVRGCNAQFSGYLYPDAETYRSAAHIALMGSVAESELRKRMFNWTHVLQPSTIELMIRDFDARCPTVDDVVIPVDSEK